MAYTKTEWIDQTGQVKYTETADGDYKIFTPNFDDVTEMGTPVDAIHMNNIENGIEYCDANMVVRKSTSQATGSATQPVYVKADGQVEVCDRSIEDTRFDGQWVSSTKTLSTSTAIGTYTIDLSTYLPNDNYNYEVIISYYGFRNSGDNNTLVSVGVVNDLPASNSDIPSTKAFAVTSFDGNHREAGELDTILFIDSNRKAYFRIANTPTAISYLMACAYRRLGTNQ